MYKQLKISTNEQLKKLVELMQQNPLIGQGKLAVGANRGQNARQWERFASQLNALGPPTRSGNEWKRVWINYKGNLKRKLSKGTEVAISELEENVIEFITINCEVDSTQSTHNLKNISIISKDKEIGEISEDSDNPTEGECELPPITEQDDRNMNDYSMETEYLAELKKQANTQVEICNTLKNMETIMHKNYKLNLKLYELKAKKAEIVMEHKKVKLALAKAKIAKLKRELEE